jgi:Flp pilus assembly protein TadD
MAKKPSSTSSGQPAAIIDPVTAEDFFSRGWTHYSKKEFFRAESDFRKSLELSPNNVEATFALAQSLQASGRPVDATAEYETLLALLANPPEANRVRYYMLARLAKGHINLIKSGDWKLYE